MGGETLVGREPDPFRSNLTQPQAGRGFHETIEPRFNRLLLFDDRLPHAVERIEGAMDPVEGRFVLHGHISEGGLIIEGALSAAAVAGPIAEVLRSFSGEIAAAAGFITGCWCCACASTRQAASPVAPCCSIGSCIPMRGTPIGNTCPSDWWTGFSA